jgi:hypothetical protein
LTKNSANGGYLTSSSTINKIAQSSVNVPTSLTGNNSRTTSIWFRTNPDFTATPLIGWGTAILNNSNDLWEPYTSVGEEEGPLVILSSRSDGSDLFSPSSVVPFTANTWFNVVYVWNGATNRLTTYGNGQQIVASASYSGGTVLATGQSLLDIGGPKPTPYNKFNFAGDMAIVRIWDTALSEAAVTTDYNYFAGRFS